MGTVPKRMNHRSLRSPSTKATTLLTSREARRQSKFHFDGLPPKVPTSYFSQDASIFRMDQLERAASSHKSQREIADPKEWGLRQHMTVLLAHFC